MSLVVRYSRRGREELWATELSESRDGPEEATELRKALQEVTGGTLSRMYYI